VIKAPGGRASAACRGTRDGNMALGSAGILGRKEQFRADDGTTQTWGTWSHATTS